MADSSETSEAPEYDAFRALASKLVKVPKDELDKARKWERSAKP